MVDQHKASQYRVLCTFFFASLVPGTKLKKPETWRMGTGQKGGFSPNKSHLILATGPRKRHSGTKERLDNCFWTLAKHHRANKDPTLTTTIKSLEGSLGFCL